MTGEMKLEVILGRSGSGKTYDCLQAMAREMARAPLGGSLVLLAPEHMTYKAERELAAQTACRGSMRGCVFGFRRLAWRLQEEQGRSALPRLSAIGKRLLLKKIIARHEGELTVLGRAAQQRGFTAALSQVIEELKSYGGTPQILAEAADVVGESYLKQKLLDIAKLYQDFQAETKDRYEDAEDRMNFLAEVIPQAEFFAEAEVWLDGFVFFNPQERRILRALLRRTGRLHITLPLDQVPVAGQTTMLFYRAQKTFAVMEALAKEEGAVFTVRQLGAPQRFSPAGAGIAALERRLFSFPLQKEANGAGVQVVEAATRRLEIEAAAAAIIRLCRDEGLRYRDIGILLRDGENYRQILEFTLTDHGIPFFSDTKRSGVHHPLAELVRSALAVILEGWRYDDVFRAAKTDLLPLERGEVDILENYVLAFGLRGQKIWAKAWPYCRQSMQRTKEGAAAWLARVNEARQQLAQPLLALGERLQEAKNVRALTQAVFDFLDTLKVADTLQHWAQEAGQAGRLAEAAEHRRIWREIMELFDQMVTVSGDEVMALEEYAAILEDGLDGLEMALIPPSLDAVTIASFDQNSLHNVPAIFILGANEGVMPRRSKDQGLISEADRARLHQIEGEIRLELSWGKEESYGESYFLYHGFTESRSYLWLSYALADSEGKGLSRSPLITRVLDILPVKVETLTLEDVEKRENFPLTVGERAVAQLAPALREYTGGAAPAWAAIYNWARQKDRARLDKILQARFSRVETPVLAPPLAHRLYLRQKRLTGSVTRLESFFACPFRHFAQYGLRLAERPVYQFSAPDFGTLLHEVMRQFGERLKAAGRRWSQLEPGERRQICQEIMAEQAPKVQNEILLSTAQYRNLQGRIQQTAESSLARLSAYDGQSAFAPQYFELAFGGNAQAGSMVRYDLGEGCQIDLAGQIDRVDVARLEPGGPLYFLVIDYKSGQNDLTLEEVFYGLRLQLLTYVLAAEKILKAAGKEPLPAGMLYCLLKNPMQEGASSSFQQPKAQEALWQALRMSGWLLDDTEVLKKIDGQQRFVKIAFKKDGSLSVNSLKKVKSLAEMRQLVRYVEKKLKEGGGAILQGEIAPLPYRRGNRNACQYCLYRTVCGFDSKREGFAFHDLTAREDFMQDMAAYLEGEKK